MDLGEEFCLVCGAPPPLFGERMCEGCTRQRILIAKIPDNIGFVRCARCGLVEIEGRWVEIPEEELWNELINREIEVHEKATGLALGIGTRKVSDRHTMLHLQIEGEVDGLVFTDELKTRARMSNGVCLTCTRKAGNYFEATVQLRSSGRKLDDQELNVMRKSLDTVISEMSDDPMFFVTKEGPVTGGWDVVLGSKGLARSWGRHLIRVWGGQVKETNSVVGRKDGMDVTRLTLLYRRPAFDIGDVISLKGDLWRINTWSNDGAIISRIAHNHRTGITWRDLEKANVACRLKDIIWVKPVHCDDSVGEFLDPIDWNTKAVRLAWDYVSGNELRLARIEGEWVALPTIGCDE